MSEVQNYDPGERIYHLRKAGISFSQIAKDFEMTTAEAVSYFRKFQTELAASYSLDDRQALVLLELERLDALQNSIWEAAVVGGLPSIDMVLKIMKQRVQLLQLDAVNPTDVAQVANILIVGGSKEEFLQAMREGRNAKGLAGARRDDENDLEEGA